MPEDRLGSGQGEDAMAEQKTQPTDVAVEDFLATVEPERRREEGIALDRLFREATGFAPVMWGPSIVGYGRYDYTYATGNSGSWPATGFSPRKAQISVYIMPGYADFGDILARLGPHSTGKSCLYIRRLDKVDTGVLAELIRAGLAELERHWPVQPT